MTGTSRVMSSAPLRRRHGDRLSARRSDAPELATGPRIGISKAADLPWRYTPDATNGDRLAPWICLIVAVVTLVTSMEFLTSYALNVALRAALRKLSRHG